MIRRAVKCPHCHTSFHGGLSSAHMIGRDPEGDYTVVWGSCPACERVIAGVQTVDVVPDPTGAPPRVFLRYFLPLYASRPVPTEVDGRFADDFREATAVLAISPKASAAISRRVLQDLIREKGGIKKRNLNAEIDELLAQNILPTHLAESVDAVRAVGNFAAHPLKDRNTGLVLDVEPGEAEWNLDTLEGLFDFWFVQPAKTQARRDATNAKLKQAGKPPLK